MIGRVDKFEIESLLKRVKKLNDSEKEGMFLEATNVVGNFVKAKATELTPVGEYQYLKPPFDARKGGDLRGAWEMTSPIKNGNAYSVIVKNPLPYASYVNVGHKQEVGKFIPMLGGNPSNPPISKGGGSPYGRRLKKSWVKGQFFLEKAIRDAYMNKNKLIKVVLDKELKKVFEDGK